MTLEDRELLFKDLCSRLPYDIYVRDISERIDCKIDSLRPKNVIELILIPMAHSYYYQEYSCSIEYIRPYLRPMSSMTDEEKKELNNILEYQYYSDDSCMCESTDWLNAHYFDYHGLIKKGLALDARGMYD